MSATPLRPSRSSGRPRRPDRSRRGSPRWSRLCRRLWRWKCLPCSLNGSVISTRHAAGAPPNLPPGALGAGVAGRPAKTALAEWSGKPLADIEEVWHCVAPPYRELFAWLSGTGPPPEVGARATFKPLMLSHQIEDKELALIDPKDFVAEWKWDGIRVQAVHQGGERRLFSPTGDDIS